MFCVVVFFVFKELLFVNRFDESELIADKKEVFTFSNNQFSSENKLEIINKSQTDDLAYKKPIVSSDEINSKIEKLIKYDVPFTSQAPLAEWDDLRQQNACEEASALMAMKWVRGESIASPEQAKKEILDIVDYQVKTHNFHYDTSTRDTVELIYKGYFKYDKVRIVENATGEDIKTALGQGSIVVAAANGQLLGNPFYTQPGPLEHMLVIIGYDPKTKEFITNDPGTKRGKDYRYKENILYGAIRDYPTGYQEPITKIEKLLIIVEK